MSICAHVDCQAPAYVRGVCKPHYERMRNRALRWADTCAVEGCTAGARCRGWCHTHYQRWRKHGAAGDAGRLRPGPPPRSTVPDLSAVRARAINLRDRDPQTARRLVDSVLQEQAV